MQKFIVASLFALVHLHVSGSAVDYDLVINDGRVMDPETLFDSRANVGIKDGRIAIITSERIMGKKTINAKGLVVAPGFIDSHFHALDPFASKLAVADGITTGMDLEAGASRIAEWYAIKEKSGWQINYGVTTGLAQARIMVHDSEIQVDRPIDAGNVFQYGAQAAKDGTPGWSVTRSSVEEMNQIMQILDADLQQGALGIGIGAAYMQRGLNSYELFEAQRTAANYGRVSSVHTRYHLSAETPSEATIALDEVLANAMTLRAPLLLAHDNDYGWWENQEKMQLARAQGYNVWSEYYPFTAGSTLISADFLRPSQWESTYGFKYEDTIYDPTLDKFLSKEEFNQLVAESPGRTVVVHMPPRQRWLKYWLTVPHMVVASDAMPGIGKDGKLLPWQAMPSEYAGHPRTSSSYSQTLQLARENGVPLMFTLSQLSYWTAKHLGDTGLIAMQERGRVQEGMIADLTLFDPAKVRARATYKSGENGTPPQGIPYVIVHGDIVVEAGKVLDTKPGKPIRFPVETTPRYKPNSSAQWLLQHTINVPVMHPIHDEKVIGLGH